MKHSFLAAAIPAGRGTFGLSLVYFDMGEMIKTTELAPDGEGTFNASDFAINPISTGSGTNVKMMEYLAAKLPILTTSFGKRGLCCHKSLFLNARLWITKTLFCQVTDYLTLFGVRLSLKKQP
jgi:hypothetical protein